MVNSLDLKLPGFMVYSVFVACLGAFSIGWTIGSANVPGEATHACETGAAHNVSSIFPDCLPMENALWGFAVASFCIGGLFGGFFGGSIQTKFGRKKTIMYNNIGWVIGAVLIGAAVNPAMFIVGRIFCGLSCGLGSVAIPAYIGEVATVKARGTMGTCNQFAIVIGILLASLIGLPLANVPLWRINFAIVAIPAVIQFFLMAGCNETPRYLISVNRIEEARENLQKLRKGADIQVEFFGMVEGALGTAAAKAIVGGSGIDSEYEKKGDEDVESNSVDVEETSREPMNMIQIFQDPTIRRIALTVLTLHCTQQLIGMNAVMYYSTTIFSMSFDKQMSMYMAIATTAVNFGATILSLILIDRMGRRPLLLIAEIGACIFSVLLIIGYVYQIGPLLIVSVFGYVVAFAIGVGPIPWMMTSEITPVYASSAVGSFATAFNWAMNFLIGQCFPIIFERIKGYSFAIFAGVALLATIFTWFKVPETKGRTLEDIVRGFEKRS